MRVHLGLARGLSEYFAALAFVELPTEIVRLLLRSARDQNFALTRVFVAHQRIPRSRSDDSERTGVWRNNESRHIEATRTQAVATSAFVD